MSQDDPTPEESQPSTPDYIVGLRYSLSSMMAEIRSERVTGTFSMEKLDQKEIGKMFKPQKRRRAPKP